MVAPKTKGTQARRLQAIEKNKTGEKMKMKGAENAFMCFTFAPLTRKRANMQIDEQRFKSLQEKVEEEGGKE